MRDFCSGAYTLRAQGHLDRIGQNIDPAQHTLAGVTAEPNFPGSHVSRLLSSSGPYQAAFCHYACFFHRASIPKRDSDFARKYGGFVYDHPWPKRR